MREGACIDFVDRANHAALAMVIVTFTFTTLSSGKPIAAVAGVWKSPRSRLQHEDTHHANMDGG
jgi:hypothetical protein